jgi:hypothetical protein
MLREYPLSLSIAATILTVALWRCAPQSARDQRDEIE